VSERIRKTCEKFNLRVVFKSGPTLRSLLTKVKDPLPKEKLAGVVYQIPCQWGKGNAEAPRDASQRTQALGCMQQGEHVEVCHR
jgi:Fe-S oxidoreductase